MKQIVTNYTFSTSGKTITLTDFSVSHPVDLKRLYLITDVTTNTVLYNFADSTVASATVSSNNVITLSKLQGGESNSDGLQIVYEALATDPIYETPLLPANAAQEAGGNLATIATNTTGLATASNQSTANTNLSTIATTQTSGAQKTQIVDGSGNVIASTSNALNVNIASGGGSATSANQTNGTQQSKITDGTNTVNVNAISGKNSLYMSPNSATGSPVPSTAFYSGGIAETSLPTAASVGNLTGLMTDKFGRLVVLPNAQRDLVLPITQLTLTSITETTLITAVASTFLDLISLVVINTSATPTQVDFRDSTGGTVRLSLYVPAGDTRGLALPTPMPQNTVNNNWTAKLGTAVTSVIITGSYITNK
jgi:hypothetical protein